jgi:hypothetical protein
MKPIYLLVAAALVALSQSAEVRAEGGGASQKAFYCARLMTMFFEDMPTAKIVELCLHTSDPEGTFICYTMARMPVSPVPNAAGLGMPVAEAVAFCKEGRK